jgi:hypothetical protein
MYVYLFIAKAYEVLLFTKARTDTEIDSVKIITGSQRGLICNREKKINTKTRIGKKKN